MRASFVVLAIAALTPTACATRPGVVASLAVPSSILQGSPLDALVTGLAPNETVTVYAMRRVAYQAVEAGALVPRETKVLAWADFKADKSGRIDAADTPLAGSFSGADQLGLIWSGFPEGDPALSAKPAISALSPDEIPSNTVRFVVERADGSRLAADTALKAYSDTIAFTTVGVSSARADGVAGGVSGVFAAPVGQSKLPAIILLHGSEGADPDTSRRWAGRMASRGYAALALHYVAYPWNGAIEGVEPAMMNVPVETLDRARAFLATRAEVDASRVGVFGISKGAELALVAASRYDWIDAVVACVPSDVVWAGYGRELAPGEGLSSWSLAGASLPAIPYDRYEDVFSGKATPVAVHNRSRAALSGAALERTRIPVANIAARVLLIGGGLDGVWASLEMADAVAATRAAAGLTGRTEVLRYEAASHFICGDGTYPQRVDLLSPRVSGAPNTSVADGEANADAFPKMLDFLARSL